jgi:hypothetical protein
MINFELNKEFLNDPWITKPILQFILSDIIDTQDGIFESEEQVYEYLTNTEKNKSVEIFYELMSEKAILYLYSFFKKGIRILQPLIKIDYYGKI